MDYSMALVEEQEQGELLVLSNVEPKRMSIMNNKRKYPFGNFFRMIATVLLTVVLSFSTAFAVDTGDFELEGNAIDNSGAALPDDWQTLFNGTGSEIVKTPIPIADPAPMSVFTGGGSKDTRDVSLWKHKTGTVPDKDDLTNAYAAAYTNMSNELLIYFGADRFSNDGDAQMAFWFFKNQISLNNDGTFNGNHSIGDVLILVNFVQGGGVPEIQVLQWVGSGGSEKQGGTLDTVIPLGSAQCVGGADNICAITNSSSETSPWPYVPKANVGTPGIFPPQTFFEGGININQVFGEARCFSSFLAETRSSQSVTAQLKDFVLGEFPVCRVELSKVCGTGTFDPNQNAIVADYTVTVENTGFATVNEIIATDDNCTPSNSSDDETITFNNLLPGNTANSMKQCVVPLSDFTSPLINSVSAVADGGDIPIVLGSNCLGTSQDACQVVCPVDLSPDIEVSKTCETKLAVESNMVKVLVDFSGDVCNTSDQGSAPTPLTSVSVTDSEAGGPLELFDNGNSLGTSTSLDPGECANFSGTYAPSSIPNQDPVNATFMDTVTGTGTEPFSNQNVTDNSTATCNLCPTCAP